MSSYYPVIFVKLWIWVPSWFWGFQFQGLPKRHPLVSSTRVCSPMARMGGGSVSHRFIHQKSWQSSSNFLGENDVRNDPEGHEVSLYTDRRHISRTSRGWGPPNQQHVVYIIRSHFRDQFGGYLTTTKFNRTILGWYVEEPKIAPLFVIHRTGDIWSLAAGIAPAIWMGEF